MATKAEVREIGKAEAVMLAEIECRQKGKILNYVYARDGRWVVSASNRQFIPREFVLKGVVVAQEAVK